MSPRPGGRAGRLNPYRLPQTPYSTARSNILSQQASEHGRLEYIEPISITPGTPATSTATGRIRAWTRTGRGAIMNAMDRPGVAAPCRTFQSRPRTGGDRPDLERTDRYQRPLGADRQDDHRRQHRPHPKTTRSAPDPLGCYRGPELRLLLVGIHRGTLQIEPPQSRGYAQPAFQSEPGDPKAASRPVSGPQVRLTRTIRPIFGCEFTPPRNCAPAPGST